MERFSPAAVAEIVVGELRRIDREMKAREVAEKAAKAAKAATAATAKAESDKGEAEVKDEL